MGIYSYENGHGYHVVVSEHAKLTQNDITYVTRKLNELKNYLHYLK